MSSQKLLSLSRLLTTTATTTVIRRSFSSSSSSSNLRFSLLRSISAVTLPNRTVSLPSSFRCLSSQPPQHYNNNNNNSGGSNRPPKETILLDGCDFEHWLVVVDPPPEDFTRDMIIDYYIKTLATLFDGSEEEARRKIYSVSTRHYFAFGALVSEELSYKLKEMEKVRWVLPDSYLDVKNKDYGGEPFIDGQAVPYDPKFHEEWVRNNQKAHERNNRGENRPRNNDRSRNFDRRQRTPEGNMGGGPPNQQGGPTRYPGPNQNAPNMAPRSPPPYQQNMPPANPGYQQNMPPANPGYQQNMRPANPGYQQNIPPANPGYQQNMPPTNPGYQQNMPPNNHGYQQNMPPNNAGGYQQNNATGYQQNIPPNNAGYQQNMPPPPPPNNMSGNYGGQGNNPAPNYQAGGGMPYQSSAPVGGQQNFAPNGGQNIPGRDLPQ